MINDSGYVYLICDPANNTYKIGVTRNLNSKRIKKLQTGNSTELHIVYTIETKYPFRLESLLHNKYNDKKLNGEWYALSNIDVSTFKDTCNNYINMINSMLNNPYFSKNLK